MTDSSPRLAQSIDQSAVKRMAEAIAGYKTPDEGTIGEHLSWQLHNEQVALISDRLNHQKFLQEELEKLASVAIAALAPGSAGAVEAGTHHKLQLRHDEISKWLGENAPYVVADQKHLDENTPERAYWHYGYKVALSDVLALVPSPLEAWQPIETAPKNREILVFCPAPNSLQEDYQRIVAWGLHGHWIIDGGQKLAFEPTHWMPLPAAPLSTTQGEENSDKLPPLCKGPHDWVKFGNGKFCALCGATDDMMPATQGDGE